MHLFFCDGSETAAQPITGHSKWRLSYNINNTNKNDLRK